MEIVNIVIVEKVLELSTKKAYKEIIIEQKRIENLWKSLQEYCTIIDIIKIFQGRNYSQGNYDQI